MSACPAAANARTTQGTPPRPGSRPGTRGHTPESFHEGAQGLGLAGSRPTSSGAVGLELAVALGILTFILNYIPNIGSTKSLSGHALSVAGVHEAIYSLLMMERGFLAESANIVNLVDEAEGLPILTERKEGPVARVMSNSFGFGGTNACLVFDKYE